MHGFMGSRSALAGGLEDRGSHQSQAFAHLGLELWRAQMAALGAAWILEEDLGIEMSQRVRSSMA